ncbi:MAG: GntR family transcriptional regulator [Clostridium sp.]|nr:GntR family transcriptional regulator [Clostridium sp.]
MTFNDNNKAIYLQLADLVCDRILRGVYPEGERIPSVRELASEMEVNVNTMMRAFDSLQQRGLIFNRRGIGYFVADNAPVAILSERREKFFTTEADYFFNRLKIFGITPARLAELYNNYLNNKNPN